MAECVDYISKTNHMWNIIKYNGDFYYFDATWDLGADGDYRYFAKTADEFSSDRQWDNADFINKLVKNK